MQVIIGIHVQLGIFSKLDFFGYLNFKGASINIIPMYQKFMGDV
jgi:hypothetical protein